MYRAEIEKALNYLIRENSPKELTDIAFEGKSIIEDLEFDSVSLMQLVAGIEETFGVSLDDSDSLLDLMDSYDELVEFILEKNGGVHESAKETTC